MMSEIKLRAWDGQKLEVYNHDITEPYYNIGLSYFLAKHYDSNLSLFIDIKDKNEREIYTGDLLIDKWEEDGITHVSYLPVVYCNKTAQYCVDNSFKKDGSSLVNLVEYFGIENLEVAGNIYENPELLNK